MADFAVVGAQQRRIAFRQGPALVFGFGTRVGVLGPIRLTLITVLPRLEARLGSLVLTLIGALI
ncbi:MAG TPA: hypothetical protein VGF42_09225 [Caulobacteraceae bacterium]